MKPKKGVTAQDIVAMMEQMEARQIDDAEELKEFGEPYKAHICEKAARAIRDILRKVAE